METNEMVAVMMAWEEGEAIQWRPVTGGKKWRDSKSPGWEWGLNMYRVKPDGNDVRPYATAIQFIKAQEEHGPDVFLKNHPEDGECRIYTNSEGTVFVAENNDGGMLWYEVSGYDDLLGNYVWGDGTPCGILEEELTDNLKVK